MGELREKKKRETRQRISDVATKLFFARGFDAVTIEEIAAEADVSKMTVFNYFTRKEDLLFDREDEVKELLHGALAARTKGQSAVAAMRALVDRLSEEKHPFARIDRQTTGWWHVVAASPSLKARLREVGDEVVESLAIGIGGPKADGTARLVAGMIVLTWRTAYAEAMRVFLDGGSVKKANETFLALVDEGFAAAAAIARR